MSSAKYACRNINDSIVKKQKPKTLVENKHVARKGGSVAGKARIDLEKKLGESVISPLNAKQLGQKKGNKEIDD